jgi:antitoxin MazE
MRSVFRKVGNSHAVIIPKPFMAEIGVSGEDPIDIKVQEGTIIIEPLADDPNRVDPRAGWAEECRQIRAAGEDGLVWPEFGNVDDDKLVW